MLNKKKKIKQMSNEENKKEENAEKTPEQIVQEAKMAEIKAKEEERKKAYEEETKKVNDRIQNILVPALKAEIPNLVPAGQALGHLGQLVNTYFNNKQQEIKISDLGLLDAFGKEIEKETNENNKTSMLHSKAILSAFKDFTVADFNQMVQWFGQKANVSSQDILKDIKVEDIFKPQDATPSPYQK